MSELPNPAGFDHIVLQNAGPDPDGFLDFSTRREGTSCAPDYGVAVAHVVVTTTVAARPTAVVRAATTWPEFPALWTTLMDEVWSCLRAQGITSGCPNVMLYLDDVPHVEVGVLSPGILFDDPVVPSALPAGRVAMTVHRGSYAGLGDAHDDVVAWCAAQGLRRAGPRWEVYGPHGPEPEVEIYYLLSSSGGAA